MNFFKSSFSAIVIFCTALLNGCGGDDTPPPAEVQTDVGPGTAQAASKKTSVARKTSSGSSGAATRSAMDQIDGALDSGNYMNAVNIAIKAGKNPQENMDALRYVQRALGDPMARGDAKATDAYQKLNAFYIMKYQR